jgi:hypothetical protein
MGDASSSRLDRLAALPALMLIVYVLFTLPAGGGARDTFPTIGSQPSIEARTGRANALRPARVQIRAPKTFDSKRPAEDSGADSLVLVLPKALAGADASAATPVAAALVRRTFRSRAHNPRAPPRRA